MQKNMETIILLGRRFYGIIGGHVGVTRRIHSFIAC